MSRLDVVKSLLRSAARSTSQQLARVGGSLAGGVSIRDRLAALLGHRLLITDRQLTAAVARIPEVAAATVSSGEGVLRIDASFRDGTDLLVTLRPLRSAFAPRGAKELSMRASPENASLNPRAADVAGAIATEVAHALWGPFLRKQPTARRAIAERHGDMLVVVASEHVPDESRGFEHELIEAIPDGLLALDSDGFVRRANAAACRLLGCSAEDVIARPITALLEPQAEQIEALESILRAQFQVERFPHSINVEEHGSDLRLQIQTDERYVAFVGRAQPRDVLGTVMPVADIADVLQGKVWAASDPTRRASKRLKDLTDIARILELRPDLGEIVPSELRDRLL